MRWISHRRWQTLYRKNAVFNLFNFKSFASLLQFTCKLPNSLRYFLSRKLLTSASRFANCQDSYMWPKSMLHCLFPASANRLETLASRKINNRWLGLQKQKFQPAFIHRKDTAKKSFLQPLTSSFPYCGIFLYQVLYKLGNPALLFIIQGYCKLLFASPFNEEVFRVDR